MDIYKKKLGMSIYTGIKTLEQTVCFLTLKQRKLISKKDYFKVVDKNPKKLQKDILRTIKF